MMGAINPLTAYMTRQARHGNGITMCVRDKFVPSWWLGNTGSIFAKLI